MLFEFIQVRTDKGNIVYIRTLGLLGFMQGVTSKRKAVIAKDRQLLKMLTEASMRGYPPGTFHLLGKDGHVFCFISFTEFQPFRLDA